MISVLLSSNGDFDYKDDFLMPTATHIIAVDGGMRHLYKLGIKPNIWVGDMDSSIGLKIDEEFLSGVEIKTLPIKKDISDSEYAVQKALEFGANEIIIIGGIGTRFDHSLFNINMLFKLAKKNILCKILDGKQEVSFLCAGKYLETENYNELIIESNIGKTLSIVPFSDLEFLSLDGFEYPLTDTNVDRYSNLTLSNIITSEKAKIKLKNGMCLVILSNGH